MDSQDTGYFGKKWREGYNVSLIHAESPEPRDIWQVLAMFRQSHPRALST